MLPSPYQCSVDLILSIQYNWVVATETIDLVKGRAFNLHNARLPDYKGYNSISHAIANGDNVPESGVVTFGGPLPRNPERTVALRKLLEAKDAAVRALLAKDV